MKTSQAWGWLLAAVVAAGLNASYYDGGLQWAHRVADRVVQHSEMVLARATGQADQFLSEMQLVTARQQTASCQLSTALARVQTEVARKQAHFDRFEAMSAREEAQLARMEANRARIEAQVARIRIPAVALNPIVFSAPKVSACPRVRVNLPRLPRIQVPAVPVIHIETASAGPV